MIALLLVLLGCSPDVPVRCQSSPAGEMVWLEPGERMLGPQCPPELEDAVEVVTTTPEGVLFLCTCEDLEELER